MREGERVGGKAVMVSNSIEREPEEEALVRVRNVFDGKSQTSEAKHRVLSSEQGTTTHSV